MSTHSPSFCWHHALLEHAPHFLSRHANRSAEPKMGQPPVRNPRPDRVDGKAELLSYSTHRQWRLVGRPSRRNGMGPGQGSFGGRTSQLAVPAVDWRVHGLTA